MSIKAMAGYRVLCLSNWMIRHHIRGGWRMQHAARDLGMLKERCFRLSDRVQLTVPLARVAVTMHDLRHYDEALVNEMAADIRIPSVLVDCGADIGLISCKLVAASPLITEVIALEPNAEGFRSLKINMASLPIPGRALNCAVGRAAGRGTLTLPPHATNYTGACMETDPDGDLEIVPLDNLGISSHLGLAIKVDVEGFEFDVIAGALQTIQRAPAVVVCLEAHRDVMKKAGDLIETMRLLTSIRPFRFRLSEQPDVELSLDRPIADQVSFDDRRLVYNVIGVST